MKSRHIIYLLSDYLDNLLDDTAKQSVEKHLSSCPKCQAKLEELKKYQDLVAQVQPHSAPEEIREKVMAQVDSAHRSPLLPAGRQVTVHRSPFTAHRSLFTVATAAAIIILLILAVPKEIFLPSTVSIDIAAVVQKKGKGGPAVTIGGIMKKGGKWSEAKPGDILPAGRQGEKGELNDLVVVDWAMVDFRLKRVLELVEEVEGEVVSAELNSAGTIYSHIIVGMSKRNYKDFVEKYNQMGLGDSVPAKAGFSMSNKVLVNLFPVKRDFFVKDYNEDGFDDMILQYTSGRLDGQWFVSLNNHMGSFYPLLEIDPDSLPPATTNTDSTIVFSGDFNGDGLIDHGTKYLSGSLSAQFHISFDIDNLRYSEPIPFTFGKGIMAWQGNYKHYFGDFNADGLCDLLTKEGNGDVLGSWYVALNNGRNGFGSTKDVVFGGKKYFVSD